MSYMVGEKTTAICCILQRFFGPLLYVGSIKAFHWTAAIVLVFCGVLQRRYLEPLQYICFSSVNLDIVALQKLAIINIAFCKDTIAAA